MTKERPILFSGTMVQALLDGRKTQTRRVLRREKQYGPFAFDDPRVAHYCPYGQPGDRLWVRETWNIQTVDKVERVAYRADIPNGYSFVPWRPSIFMPRRFSRITLEITDVRVERVRDISEADARAEGVTNADEGSNPIDGSHTIANFANLWEKINAKRDYGWQANPWVWVIEFNQAGSPMTDTDCMDQIIAQAAAPLLSRAEARVLFPLAQAGDAAAHERCVAANLRLVIAIAARYQHNGLELPDLIQEGTIGLLRAVAGFDATRDIAFSTYATNWIRQAIQRAIHCRGRAIRLPVHVHETCAKARRAANQLAVDGQDADTAAITAVSGISAQRLATLFALPDTTSLDAPHDRTNGDPYTLAELIPAPSPALEDAVAEADWHVYQRAQVTAALATLDARARFVLELRYGLNGHAPHTLEAVGARLDPPLTRERARQIERDALRTLRETAAACGLVGLL